MGFGVHSCLRGTLLRGAKQADGPSITPGGCETRRQLADAFATAARLYAEAVVEYTRSARVSQDEYNRLHHAAEAAQQRSEECRIAFEEHVSWHQCHEREPVQETTTQPARPHWGPASHIPRE